MRVIKEVPETILQGFVFFIAVGFRLFGGKTLACARNNLSAILPAISKKEQNAVLWRFCRHVASTVVEFIRYEQRPERFSRSFIQSIDADERVFELIKKGNGLILLSGHYGAWELLGGFASRNYGATVIVNKLKFAPLEKFLQLWRSKIGMKTIENEKNITVLNILRRGGVIGILPDLYFDKFRGVEVNFFGKTTRLNAGPAYMHLSTKSPIVILYILPLENAQGYEIRYGGVIEYESTGDKLFDVCQVTQLWGDMLAKQIRAKPELWIGLIHDI